MRQRRLAEHHPGRLPDSGHSAAVDLGAVFAGVGVSAIIPARGGDAVRVFLAKRCVPESTYTTITSTVVLLSLFDFFVAGSLVLWAAASGYLPGSDVLGPSFDFGWVIRNPGTFLKAIGLVLVILLVMVLWFAEQIGDFRRRIGQGFLILRDKQAYFSRVASGRWRTGSCGSRPCSCSCTRSACR